MQASLLAVKSLASESKFLKWNLFGEMEIYAHFWPEAKALYWLCESSSKSFHAMFYVEKVRVFPSYFIMFHPCQMWKYYEWFLGVLIVIAGKVIYCVIWWRLFFFVFYLFIFFLQV